MPRLPLAAFAFFAVLAAHAADSRSAFLKLLDRPRVPLAADVSPPVTRDALVETAFSFDAEAGERVPGLLVKSATSNGRRPVVIVLHGTGGNKESQRALLAELARDGFAAVAIDGRFHGARAKAGKEAKSAEYVGAILERFRTGRGYPFFYDTAWDVMRLIDYLETRADVDPRRIGAIGFSKGGIETYLAAAIDPRIAVAVPCIGVQSFRWALENNSWQSRIETVQAAFNAAAKDSGVAHPGAEFVRTFYDRVAPGIYGEFDGPAMVPLIAPRPLLSINGEIDPRTPGPGLKECADAARAAYRAAGADDRFVLHVQPATAHKVLPESLVLARDWFKRWLKP
ncbi:alpha/beta hydrolase family protein [Horticoccus sp. 23ND18S-11]|uniref:alpha/beta hydrolase family protein n=1 Tax=Horticoccus sp. 23ND18S-11 TaxID=3391832 RepID=UPI0039C8F1F7